MKRKQILVVENERIVAEDIKIRLQKHGYDVPGIANSGQESIKKAEELSPDIVLMDIVLDGEMDGIDAALIIQSRLDIPVVYLTAYSDKRTLRRAKITEPYGYLVKPFEDKDLYTTIEIALYRHEVGKLLKESEERYRALFDRSLSCVYVHDFEGNFLDANTATLNLLGYKKKDIPSLNFTSLLDNDQLPQAHKAIGEIKKTGFQKKPSVYRLRKKDGSFAWVETEATLIYRGGEPYVIQGIARDITGRKKLDEEFQKSQEQLRNLAAHLQTVREEERMLVAREIHDELGQTLTALKMDLSILGKRMPEDKSSLLKKIESMTELIDTTIQTVKRISAELRPGLLDDLGLFAAIDWLGEEFQNRTGIKCSISIDSEEMLLSQDRSTAIFRILQEALTNVARHARATQVRIRVKKKENHLMLHVKDNGKGILEEQLLNPKSYGLIGIKERVHSLGGLISIKGALDKGTKISVSIPFSREGEIP